MINASEIKNKAEKKRIDLMVPVNIEVIGHPADCLNRRQSGGESGNRCKSVEAFFHSGIKSIFFDVSCSTFLSDFQV